MSNQLRYGLATFVIMTLLLVGGILIFLALQAQQREVKFAQQERSRAAAGEINAYLDDLQRKLGYLARVQGLTEMPPDVQRRLLQGLTRHNKAYEIVAILDEKGQIAVIVSPYGSPNLTNLVDSSLFLQPFRNGQDFVSSVKIGPDTGSPVVILSVPIRDDQDQIAGVLLAQVDLSFLWSIIARTNVGETGYAYLIDNRRFLIAKTNTALEPFTIKDISEQPFIQDLTARVNEISAEAFNTYRGLNNQTVLGAISRIEAVNWYVIVELPTAEIYAPVRRMLLVMGLALGGTTVIAVGLGFLVTRQFISPLRQLTAASAQISAGNLETQVNINSRNELGILATTFNIMTDQLQMLIKSLEDRIFERERAEMALRDYQDHLEELVEARTAALKRTNQQLQVLTDQLQAELTLAHEIQQGFLPPPRPNWSGPDVICYSSPAREVGGDFYAYYAFDQGGYNLIVGDVSGKGMPAALLMAVSTASLQSIVAEALSPAELLVCLDKAIGPYTQSIRQNCALISLALREDRLQTANAGCVMPLIRRVEGTVEWIDIGGIPLGMGLGVEFGYREVTAKVSKGDLVILTSDGVIEANNAVNEMFGFDRLAEAAMTGPATSAEAMLNHLQAEIGAFVGGTEANDDVTIVVMQV